MMGSVDFLGGCPAGSHLKSSKIGHWKIWDINLKKSMLWRILIYRVLRGCCKVGGGGGESPTDSVGWEALQLQFLFEYDFDLLYY